MIPPPPVQRGFLVTFDDREPELPGQLTRGALEQCCLAGPRRAHQVDGEHATAAQPLAAALGDLVVLGQYLLLQDDRAVAQCRALQVDMADVVVARVVPGPVLVAVAVLVIVLVAGFWPVAVPGRLAVRALVVVTGREQLHNGTARASACPAHIRPP